MRNHKQGSSILEQDGELSPWLGEVFDNDAKLERWNESSSSNFVENFFDVGKYINKASSAIDKGVEKVASIPLIPQITTVEGYEDPANTGNLLYKIEDRKHKLSKNFTIDEFAQADGRKFDYFRYDFNLINTLQNIRDTVGKPVEILRGYYPPFYSKLKYKYVANDPHFSGQAVLIRVKGLNTIDLAEMAIPFLPEISRISIGESSIAIYTDKDSPKVSSWIKDEKKAAEAIARLEKHVKKINADVINVYDYDNSIPDIINKISLPIFDQELTKEGFEKLSNQFKETEEIIIKLNLHKNIYEALKSITYLGEAEKVSAGFKMILERDKTLKNELSNLKSETDIVGKLTLLRSSFGLISEIQKAKSISNKKKIYSEYFRNNPSIAVLFVGTDYFEAISKMTYETVNIMLIATYLLTKDAEIFKIYKDFSKIGKGLIVVIEGFKIIKNLTLILIDFINGKGLNLLYLKEIIISIATIVVVLKVGETAALATALLILELTVLNLWLQKELNEYTYSTVVGGASTYVIKEDIKDIDENFEKIVIKYVEFKCLIEQVYFYEGLNEQLWSEDTKAEVGSMSLQLVNLLVKFCTRAGGYKEPIVTRILNKERISEINLLSSGLELGNPDKLFTLQYDVMERMYNMLYEGIVKVHKEINKVVKEQMNNVMSREYSDDPEILMNVKEWGLPTSNIAEFESNKTQFNASDGHFGQQQLNSIKSKVAQATNNDFSASNWFQYIVRPTFLGHKIQSGVHILLWLKLQEAQTWLLAQPQFKGMTPVELGRALGLDRPDVEYSGARLSKDNQAMHSFGLAIDIDKQRHSWIGAGWVKYDKEKLKERSRMLETLRKASGEKLPGSTVFEYLHSIAQDAGSDTRAAYSILKKRNDEFIAYLKRNPAELGYWKSSATFGDRDPLRGFLSLHPDLVYALREVAGLAWGAIDFGPRACGDIMHFDMRMSGIGQVIANHIGGFVPSSGHPIYNASTLNEIWYEEAYDHTDEDWTDDEYHEAIGEGEWTETNSHEEEDFTPD